MMHAVARRFPAVFPPLLGLVWLASTLAIQADTTDGAWQAAKVDFLRLSRQEHNARIAEWREVAAWTFDHRPEPGSPEARLAEYLVPRDWLGTRRQETA